MSYKTIEFESKGAVGFVTLNRPEVLNAITDEMCSELLDVLGRVSDPHIRAVHVTGAGRAFSSGADLGKNGGPSTPVALRDRFEWLFNPIIIGLRELPKPVVAAVNGAAVGYGAALALCADVIFASDKAFFLTAAASAGILPDGGLTAFLPTVLGPARAAGFVFNGDRLTAERAADCGLVTRCCPADELAQLSREAAERLAAGPTLTFAATKRAFNAQLYPNLADQLRLEAETQQELSATADYREGTTAFKERRAPRFTGA